MKKIILTGKTKYIKIDLKKDFFSVFKAVEKNSENCFLFESLGTEANNKNRYSLIGFNPDTIVKAKGKIINVGGISHEVENPYNELRDIMPEPILSQSYPGGMVGYVSYEAANYFEPELNLKLHPDFDQFCFGVYTDGILYDNVTGETSYFHNGNNRLKLLKQIIAKSLKQKAIKNPKVIELGPNVSKIQHKAQVQEVLKEIKAGNTFQCEVGLKINYEITGGSLPIYEKLRKINPSPYMFFVKFGSKILLGSSPELLFSLRQKNMQTFPLAGTIKRGKNEAEDRLNARRLVNDPKEQAEHKMLVDLHRNDLGRVAKFGTINVSRFMDIKKFSHVMHISSEISGIIKSGEDMYSALASCFPAGTLSGAPKIESMKIINRQEPDGRGPYGGGVGFFGFNGDCEFAIPIRSVFISGSKAYTQACGGIVYDSSPKKEYEEIINKLKASSEVLNIFK
ncbi:MAG: anthranilate synthase component I family protein [Patescibacteria group bacterium]